MLVAPPPHAEGQRVHEVHEARRGEALDVGGDTHELGVGEIEGLPRDELAQHAPHPGVPVERHLEGERQQDSPGEARGHGNPAQGHGHDTLAEGRDGGDTLRRNRRIAKADEREVMTRGQEAQLVVGAQLVPPQQGPGEARGQEEDAQLSSRRRTTRVVSSRRRMKAARWREDR